MTISLDIIDSQTLDNKKKRVNELLTGKKVLVAYSGGVDSTVIAYLSSLFAEETRLIMQIGSSVPQSEVDIAQKQADQLGLAIKFIEYNEVDHSKAYAENNENRCYHCKDLLFRFIENIKEEKEYDLIVSGTNLSDLGGHRPGHRASLEHGVLNPLVDARINKAEVRKIAAEAGLITAEKPATACLASRVITGIPITVEKLDRIAAAEQFIKLTYDIKILRVRDHGDLARIEVGSEELPRILVPEIMENIDVKLRNLGYNFVTIDMKGYRPSIPVSFQKKQ